MSSPTDYPSQPSPSPSPDSSQNGPQRKPFNHSSVALICVFIICFSFFLYLSSRVPRVSQPVRRASVTARRFVSRRRKPKLWEVWLDSGLTGELEHPQGGVFHWRPIAAWTGTDDDPNPHYPRQNSLRPELMVNQHAPRRFPSPYSFRPERRSTTPPPPTTVSDRPKLNVAILVAMPSPQNDAQPVKSGLSYHEGQLSFGITGFSREEQAMRKAPGEYDWTL